MKTPIFDFVKKYADRKSSRFHMPGHKGEGKLGCEVYDITEVSGADVLYSADGIINESENNLTALYGTAHSYYSTEGSTLAIKAMLALACSDRREGRPLILAARNVHTAFIKAAALLDIDVEWIYPHNFTHLCACNIGGEDVRRALSNLAKKPCAVYVTSPDYLGNLLDIRAISDVCREGGLPLLVDNAHGAYLKFLEEDIHPITLGAAMCADSAHKTLPVLTGGAYLHISRDYSYYTERAREALSLFASTSPSYLTLASLDLCNDYLADGYTEKLATCARKIDKIKSEIASLGFEVVKSEPLKIVLKADESFVDFLREQGIEPEFADGEYLVLMATPENRDEDFARLIDALKSAKIPEIIIKNSAAMIKNHKREMSIKDAILSPSETLSIDKSLGRICAAPTVSCPPAVPIVISGEVITQEDVNLFKFYGIKTVSVTKTGPN